MPEVYIYSQRGCTNDERRVLVKEISEIVARNLKVAPEVVMVQIIARDHSGKHRTFVHRGASDVIHWSSQALIDAGKIDLDESTVTWEGKLAELRAIFAFD